jgi:hypothetical protein
MRQIQTTKEGLLASTIDNDGSGWWVDGLQGVPTEDQMTKQSNLSKGDRELIQDHWGGHIPDPATEDTGNNSISDHMPLLSPATGSSEGNEKSQLDVNNFKRTDSARFCPSRR